MSVFFHNKGELIEERTMREEHTFPVTLDNYKALVTPLDLLNIARGAAVSKYGAVGPAEIRYTNEISLRKNASKKTGETLTREDVNVFAGRTAVSLEIPNFDTQINGADSGLSIAIIKPFNLDNYNRSSNYQHARVAIGYKVRVCLNMCMSVEGSLLDLKYKDYQEAKNLIEELIESYNNEQDLQRFEEFSQYSITEQQFANVIGRMRLYHYLSNARKAEIGKLVISDTLITQAVKQWLSGTWSAQNGSCNMWDFYNQLTAAVKDSPITEFLDRNVNCMEITSGLIEAMKGNNNSYAWYLQ